MQRSFGENVARKRDMGQENADKSTIRAHRALEDAMVRTPEENEKFVESHWLDMKPMIYGRFDICDPEGEMNWSAAAEFTEQRLEAITLAEFDIAYLEGCGISTMEQGESQKRILAREQAALVELKRGMKW
jgi:hypothetical protein